MLHTLSVSPWCSDLDTMCRLLKEGDDLLLLSDGVMAAIAEGHAFATLSASPATLYALEEDIAARGLTEHIADTVIQASYADFVRLTIKHCQQFAW